MLVDDEADIPVGMEADVDIVDDVLVVEPARVLVTVLVLVGD